MTSHEPPGQHRTGTKAVIAGVVATAIVAVGVISDLDALRTSRGSDALLYLAAFVAVWVAAAVWATARPGPPRTTAVLTAAAIALGSAAWAQREGGLSPDLLSVGARVVTADCAGTQWVFPREPSDFDPSSTASLRLNNGAVASPGLVDVQLASRDLQAVTIRRIEFEVVSTADLPLGAAVYGYPCGDTVAARFLAYDLDRSRTIASSAIEEDVRWSLASDDPGRPVLVKPMVFPFDVTGSENLTLVLAAVTSKDVRWRAIVHWARGEAHGKEVIDDNGQPFRTAGTKGLPYMFWVMGGEGEEAGWKRSTG